MADEDESGTGDNEFGERSWKSGHSLSQGPAPMAVELALTGAFRRVFHGSPSREDQEVVLAELLSFSGFTRVSSDDTPASTLMYREGRRQLYSRIFGFLALSSTDIRALEIAAPK